MELGGEDAAGLVLRAAEDGAAEGTLQQPLPQAAAGAGIGDGLGDRARADACARLASVPKLAGSSVSSRVLISRARTGAAPSVAIATVTGARSTMAGMMKVESSGASTTLTGMPRALAARETAASSSAVAGRGIDEALALQVAGQERAQHDPDRVLLLELAQLVGDGLGDDGDVRAGLAQQPHLLRGLLAAADHEHVRLVEIGKEGEIAHGPSGSRRDVPAVDK